MKLPFTVLSVAALVAATPTIYLIRHGEKPSSGNGLSTKGEERAQCLRTVFGANSSYNIEYIMAQQYDSDGSRERPYLTVEPLATDLGLTVDVHCDRDDPDCVASQVGSLASLNGNILICWEHDALSDIVSTLGDNNAPDYPSSHYDLIWVDPPDYSAITSQSSENCPGLDG